MTATPRLTWLPSGTTAASSAWIAQDPTSGYHLRVENSRWHIWTPDRKHLAGYGASAFPRSDAEAALARILAKKAADQ